MKKRISNRPTNSSTVQVKLNQRVTITIKRLGINGEASVTTVEN